MALSRRHELSPLNEPEYEFEDVPRARPDLEGSSARRMIVRDEWIDTLAEMVLLTNKAGEEFEKKMKDQGQPIIHPGKALGLEYMADRADTDDPLWGWTIRSSEEGWLQGYICVTTFTTWQRWFRWDTLCEAAGVLPIDRSVQNDLSMTPEERVLHQWWDARVIDGDGRVARALNRQIRDGDWTDEGVVWPRLAEVSLLGGLGCGGTLLDAVIEELSIPKDRKYDYIIVQATENAVPFYESRGFVRVGAIARFEQKVMEGEIVESINYAQEKINATILEDDEGRILQPGTVLTGTSSPCDWITTIPHDTPSKIAKRLNGISAEDIVFLNRRIYPELTENALLRPGTRLRIPRVHSLDLESDHRPVQPVRVLAGETRHILENDAKNGKLSSNGHWYRALNGETIKKVAKSLGIDVEALVAYNKGRYPDISEKSALQDGTILCVPNKPVDLSKIYALTNEPVNEDELRRRKEEFALLEAEVVDPKLTTFYSTNKCDDVSIVEGRATKKLSEVMAYRHWTFPDDPAPTQSPPSYMMALPLQPEYLKQHVPSIRNSKSALEVLKGAEKKSFRVPPFNYDPNQVLGPQPSAPALLPHVTKKIGRPLKKLSTPKNTIASIPMIAEPLTPVSPEAVAEKREPENIRVFLRSDIIKSWRQGPLGQLEQSESRVFMRGCEYAGPIEAFFESGAPKPRPPLPPKRPTTSFLDFCALHRTRMTHEHPGVLPKDITLLLSDAWKQLSPEVKKEYEEHSIRNREEYQIALSRYRTALTSFHREFGLDGSIYDLDSPGGPKLKRVKPGKEDSTVGIADDNTMRQNGIVFNAPVVQHMLNERALPPGVPRLFNKVVRVTPKWNTQLRQDWLRTKNCSGNNDAQPAGLVSTPSEGSTSSNDCGGLAVENSPSAGSSKDAEYYFILTYIPDLRWCRLAPLKEQGVFSEGASRKKGYEKHVGKTRWMLAPESQSKEIDISSNRCVVVKAFSVRNVKDADKEEWAILDSS